MKKNIIFLLVSIMVSMGSFGQDIRQYQNVSVSEFSWQDWLEGVSECDDITPGEQMMITSYEWGKGYGLNPLESSVVLHVILTTNDNFVSMKNVDYGNDIEYKLRNNSNYSRDDILNSAKERSLDKNIQEIHKVVEVWRNKQKN